MAFDGIVIHAIVNELSKTIVGGRIDKIYQPLSKELIIRIRTRGENHQLFLTADPTNPRIHLTNKKFTNPDIPPMFCMLLRKYLENSRIKSISQWKLERIIRIEFETTNEIGDPISYWLVAEIMGRHSNIILVDPHKKIILDCIHHVNHQINSFRELLPGKEYNTPPLQSKLNLLEVDIDTIQQLVNENIVEPDKNNTENWERFFVSNFQGISPLVSNELWARANNDVSKLANIGISLKDALINHSYNPCITNDSRGAYLKYSAIDLYASNKHATIEYHQSINYCVDEFYSQKAQQQFAQRDTHDLSQKITSLYKRAANKIEKLKNTLVSAGEAEQYKFMGELLTANLYQISKGQKQVEVINYYDPEQTLISIPLDVRLSPSQNAQSYFKKYNKQKNSIPKINEQIDLANEEMLYFDTILQQLEAADIQVVADIRQELIDEGYIFDKSKPQKKKHNKPASEPLKCNSTTGIEIWIGRNNKQNDLLTTQIASKNDTWLHTKDIPGSHVVIRSQQFDEQTLLEAANIAAYFSKARESSNVPVDYTLVKNVRKPNGSKPGFVIYDQQKTIYITPDYKLIQTLINNN